jgi:hypothetical protein
VRLWWVGAIARSFQELSPLPRAYLERGFFEIEGEYVPTFEEFTSILASINPHMHTMPPFVLFDPFLAKIGASHDIDPNPQQIGPAFRCAMKAARFAQRKTVFREN